MCRSVLTDIAPIPLTLSDPRGGILTLTDPQEGGGYFRGTWQYLRGVIFESGSFEVNDVSTWQ